MFRELLVMKKELPRKTRRQLWALRVVVATASFAVIIGVVSIAGGDTGKPRWLLLALVIGVTAEWIGELLARRRLRIKKAADGVQTLR